MLAWSSTPVFGGSVQLPFGLALPVVMAAKSLVEVVGEQNPIIAREFGVVQIVTNVVSPHPAVTVVPAQCRDVRVELHRQQLLGCFGVRVLFLCLCFVWRGRGGHTSSKDTGRDRASPDGRCVR